MMQLQHQTRRGGWMTEYGLDRAEVERRLPTIKAEAVVRNEHGEIIGGVEKSDRVWHWWIESEDR